MPKFKIAVVGSGVSGLSCAWALSQRHHVTLIEAADRLGGHSNTVHVQTKAGPVAVDTGFIVFNPATYPNFAAMMDYLDQPLVSTQMSFSVSADDGRYEYSGNHLGTLFGTHRQWRSPRHWRMMADLLRFYRQAEGHAAQVPKGASLGRYLQDYGYGEAFMLRHILPMAGAIWSATPEQIAAYPFHAFIRFFSNHNLFELGDRADWNTVKGGSAEYVKKLALDARFDVRVATPVERIVRTPDGIDVYDKRGGTDSFDHVVLATHADTSLRLLHGPSADEKSLLSLFKTSANRVYLHRDASLMPATRRFWSGWNYRVPRGARAEAPEVTYWMNHLQKLDSPDQHFVTLNPQHAPKSEHVDGIFDYRHPMFNAETMEAQKELWSLQGADRVWFCGAWFGAGFHEDGLQAGLAVAEQLGGVRRPWNVADESSRIHLGPPPQLLPTPFVEAAE